MNRFAYARPATIAEAVQAAESPNGVAYLGGGTNLIDLIKENVARPHTLVGLERLPLDRVVEHADGRVHLGARVTNADVAYHPTIERRYPLLAQAILAGASAQLRNMATTGGNLLQRTRCYYFYDAAVGCNKRAPGSGCPALQGYNRIHAILGASDQCIAVHPSDMCVALAALEAVVHVEGRAGSRTIPFADFHRLPGDDPTRDTTLQPGELIVGVELPAAGFSSHYEYLKIRDRASFSFALVSVAAALELDRGAIVRGRLVLGGVAHRPWRVATAEAMFAGQRPGPDLFAAVAAEVLQSARGFEHNTFKIELARRAIARALTTAAERTATP